MLVKTVTNLVDAPEFDFRDILMTLTRVSVTMTSDGNENDKTLCLNARSTDLNEDYCINYDEKESRHHLKANSHKLHVTQPGLGEVRDIEDTQ